MPVASLSAQQRFMRMSLALAVGLIGSSLFVYWRLPLPWLLGSMCICTVLALLKAPLLPPLRARPVMIAILAVMLGSRFAPDFIDRAGDWFLSLILLGVYIAIVAAVTVPYLQRVAGYDRVTAYFSAMPGGLSEMVIVGGAMGGDERKISLVHATRILLVVFIVPFWFQLVNGIQIGDRSSFGVSITEIAPLDFLTLGLCIAIGWPIAKVIRLPAPQFFGPLLMSAALHLTGASVAEPPSELVNLAQLVIGVTVGARFVGTATGEVLRAIGFGIVNTSMILGLCGLFAYSLHKITDVNVPAMILAYAPGGMPEMSLIALAMGLDVAFVVTHHATRAAFIFIGTPLVFRLLERRRARLEKTE